MWNKTEYQYSRFIVIRTICLHTLVNISLLKYLRTTWLVRKLNTRKYMRNINDNAV